MPRPNSAQVPSSRPPLERMLRIHEELQKDRGPNCSTLAKQLEVSTKTILRDIEFMRDRLNLPIVYEETEYAYRYTSTVESFPTVQVSEGEMFALLIAQQALEQYRGTPFEHSLESAFGKIVSGLSDSVSFKPGATGVSFRNTGASDAKLEDFQALSTAINQTLLVHFLYQKIGDESPSARLVHPHHLACIQGAWYLIAYDPAREGLRNFSLARLSQLQVQTQTFARQADFDPEVYFKNSFGVFSGEGTTTVRLRFSSRAGRIVAERFWHASQSIEKLASGEYELSLALSDLTEVEHWILGWGAQVRVLEPASLAARVRASAEGIFSLYDSAPGNLG